MMPLKIALVAGVLLVCSASRLLAQSSEVQYQLYEEVYNGSLSIYQSCSATNPQTNEYYSVEAGCGLFNPEGGEVYANNGGYQVEYSAYGTHYPATISGQWTGYANYVLSMVESCCDGNGYSYFVDPDGFSDYGNRECDSTCYFYGTGEEQWLENDPLFFAYSSETVYVDPITVQISPLSTSLDGGQSQEFIADIASGIPGGYNSGITWTLDGAQVGSGNTYTYTAPPVVTSGATHSLQACSTVTPVGCAPAPATIKLLAETISINPPIPPVLLADGVSTSAIYALLDYAPEGAVVTWSASPGTIESTGNSSATYQAPNYTAFSSGTPNPLPVTITGSYQNDTGIKNTTTITIVEPISITSVSPATWTAGTTISVTISGAGFGTNPSVSFSSTSWGSVSINTPCTETNTSIICSSVSIPTNLSNMTVSQNVTVTVSATTSGITPPPATSSVSVNPINYTYGISLLPSTSSLTYNYSSTITPVITCKTSSGAACAGGVYNPQLANFRIQSGPGSLSCTSNCSSSAFTDNVLILYPAQNAIVQGCASVSTNVCATVNFTIPATSISLNPATMFASLTAGKTQSFSASVQNFGTASGLTWTLSASPSNAAPGTLTSAATTLIGSPTSGTSTNLYTAPATITTPTTVTLTACLTLNTSLCATPVAITLQPAPTFSVTATNNHPSQTALSLGHSTSYTVNVSALYGFTGTETLSVSGLPAGVTANWSNTSIATSGSATLTLQSAYSATTAKGTFPVTITGTSSGTGGNISNFASFTLTSQALQYAGSCSVPTSISRFYPNPLFPF